MKKPVYMDGHATTRCDPRVVEKMFPFYLDQFGNASSQTHKYGEEAKEAVEKARGQIASLLGSRKEEILFTSGATESDNLSILGVTQAYAEKGKHIITSPTEHSAVLKVCEHLEKHGYRITRLKVDAKGQIDPKDIQNAIEKDTVLISFMSANNELGTIHPMKEIGRIAKANKVIFHSDAAQGVGKIPIDVEAMGVDLLSISGHKMHGPKGVGALYVRKSNPRVRLAPLFFGAGHERGLRSGTLNVPGIVGLGVACEIAEKEMSKEILRVRSLRDHLQNKLTSELFDLIKVNGDLSNRLPGNLHVSFSRIDGIALIEELQPYVAVSAGAACASTDREISHVLKAIGLDENLARASIRFGLGRFNTQKEVDYVAEQVIRIVSKLRKR